MPGIHRKTPRRLQVLRESQQRSRLRKSPARVALDKKKNREWRAANPLPKHLARHYRLRCLYGISLDDYERMVVAQYGCCAVCPRSLSDGQSNIDHDHCTGKVRGVLCSKCNFAIGFADDDPKRLRSLAEYLEHHQ